MSRDRLLRLYRPGKLEVLAWFLGVTLLLVYAGARFWTAAERDAALDEFRAQQQRSSDQIDSVTLSGSAALPPLEVEFQPASLTTSEPDTSRWSATRIAAFFDPLIETVAPEAVLEVAALGLEVPVYPGTTEWNLNRGAGRIEGTPKPGSAGNVGIAAHRDGYFRALADIQLGERVTLSTVNGDREYRVTSIQVVAPDAVEVLAATEVPSLTLVTCYPFYHVGPAPERFIVRAEQIPPTASAQLAAQRHAGAQTYQQQAAQAD